MILFGIHDLSLKQLQRVLLGDKLQLENKINKEFQQKFSEDQKITLDIKPNVSDVFLPYFNRAFLLTIAYQILRNRTMYNFESLQAIIDHLNNQINNIKENKVYNYSQILPENFNKEDLCNLQINKEKIQNTTNLLVDYFMIKTGMQLSIVEGCIMLESNQLGFKFLDEIKKGNTNRDIQKFLTLYRNFFKDKTPNKKNPRNDFIREIYVNYQLNQLLNELKIQVQTEMSFCKKPYLQNKTIDQSKYLKIFNQTPRLYLYKHIFEIIEQLQTLKFQRKNKIQKQQDNSISSNFVLNILSLCIENIQKEKKKSYSQSYLIFQDYLQNINIEQYDYDSFKTLQQITNQSLETFFGNLKNPKIPKGTRDSDPLQMSIKSKAIQMIKNVYIKHGAVEIDTPVFELKETLLGKYGEEGGKLIYDLEDQGGELTSLRYDLTVPFARFMGTNNLRSLKRFHIGKVYRRDQPNMNKGRFREFYQCDFDIAGKSENMLADAEVISIMCEILQQFDLDFEIKVSHRKLLEAIIECSDCDMKKFKTICSSIDKLDKEPWENVAKELINEKGLTEKQTSNLKNFVLFKGNIFELVQKFKDNKLFGDNKNAELSLNELEIMGQHLKILGHYDRVFFDLSLARGLDYYTGLIQEAVLVGQSGLGSIGGGGRYDHLIGMFSKHQIPSVGMSIGIERLFLILEKKNAKKSRAKQSQVFVGSIGKKMCQERLKILNLLWQNNIKAESSYEQNPKPNKQLKQALNDGIDILIWIGEDELKEDSVQLKFLKTKEEKKIKIQNLLEELNKYLNKSQLIY